MCDPIGGGQHSPTGHNTSLPDLQCAICAQRAHGCHFGVVACRPCAAFFRRCIAESRNYRCLRGTNKCDIRKEGHRNACKACRLRLCRLAGMTYNPNAEVDASGGGAGGNNRKGSNSPTATAGRNDSSASMLSFCGAESNNHNNQQNMLSMERHLLQQRQLDENSTPTLTKIVQAHNAFIAGQRSLFLALHPEAAFQDFMMIIPRVEENMQMIAGSKPLMFSMLNEALEPFRKIDHQIKMQLMDDCYRQLGLLHSCHLTIAEFPHIDDGRYLANVGHLLDNNQMDTILAQWAEGTTDPEEYVSIKKPLMQKYYKFIHMFKEFPEGVSQKDFCALMAITVWNIADQNYGHHQRDWQQHKETIFSEWILDLNSRLGGAGAEQAPALLMARLLCTLVELNALTSSMEEAATLYRIFKPEISQHCADMNAGNVPRATNVRGGGGGGESMEK